MPDLCHLSLTGKVTYVFNPYETKTGNWLHKLIVTSEPPKSEFAENGLTLSSKYTVKFFSKEKDIDIIVGDEFQCVGRLQYGTRKDEKTGNIYAAAFVNISSSNDWTAICNPEENNQEEDTNNMGKTNTKKQEDEDDLRKKPTTKKTKNQIFNKNPRYNMEPLEPNYYEQHELY